MRLMGRFRLYRDGVELQVPLGRAASAFKLLVLNGGVVHRDTMIEHLWPGEPTQVGRARLRNVLSRVRRDTGAIIERTTDSVILDDDVRCDLVEFIMKGSRALSGIDGREESFRMCLEAQELWAGAPLEDNRFEPWADQVRKRAYEIQARMWELLEAVQKDPHWPRPDPHAPPTAPGVQRDST